MPDFPFIQVMNEQGEIVNESLRPPELTDEKIRELYEKMLFIKIADQKALNMQRQGRMGTYPSVRGQEAIQIASTTLLKKTDWIVPAFRDAFLAGNADTPDFSQAFGFLLDDLEDLFSEALHQLLGKVRTDPLDEA